MARRVLERGTFVTTNPFPGPQPYRAADRRWFFGRDDMVHQLFGCILANRSVMVYGPSGAGKSSILQAAVFPALVERQHARIVRVDAWPEGNDPLSWLRDALYAGLGLGDAPSVGSAADSVFRAVRAAARSSSRPLIVYLDQLEQLFFTGRTDEETRPFFDCLEELVDMPLRALRVVLTLREDYLGRFRDRLRHLPRIRENAFRVGPLTVGELIDAVVLEAAAGEPPQTWSRDEMRDLMMQVRVPGQSATEEAEAQSAYAQIICRTLFQERAEGKTVHVAEAETILEGYLESTLVNLGPLAQHATQILEQQLVSVDGSRTLRTEKELGRIVGQPDLGVVLKQLENAAILRAEEHRGGRYFEIGHDWLARRVYKSRGLHEQAEAERKRQAELHAALEKEREESRLRLEKTTRQRQVWAIVAGVSIFATAVAVALFVWALRERERAERASDDAKRAEIIAKAAEDDARTKAIEASDARLMAGFRELRNSGQVEYGLKLLHEVQKPEKARGWIALANDGLLASRLEITLQGATTPFSAVAWSHDGKRIAATSEDRGVWIWNGNGDPVRESTGSLDSSVVSLAWSLDDKHLITATANGKVCLVDPYGKEKPIEFDPQAGSLRQVVVSPDGSRIAILAKDRVVRIWFPHGPAPIQKIAGHTGTVTSVAFFPNGKSIVTGSEDKTARIVALNTPDKSIVLLGHKGPVRWAKPSPDGRFVVTTSDDKTARVWPVFDKGLPVVLEGHNDVVSDAAWSPDGKLIATASRDKTGRIWSADGKGKTIILSAPDTSVASVAFRPDGRYVLTRSSEQTIAVWPSSGGKPLVIEAHSGAVASAVWSPDGRRIVSAAGSDLAVKVWRMDQLEALPRDRRPFFHNASILPEGDRVVAAFNDRAVRLFRLDGTGNPVVFTGHDDWVTSVAASPDGLSILTTSLDKTARIIQVDDPTSTGKVVLRGAERAVRTGAWSPDGQRVVTCSDDNKARVWRVDGEFEREWSGHDDILTHAVWSRDGKFVATTSMDHTARIWPVDGTGSPIVLKGHGSGVVAAAWNADGTRIVTASEDFTAQVWLVSTGQPLFVLDHDGLLNGVAWSPDGKYIATSSIKNGLRVWNALLPGEPIEFPMNSPVLAMMFSADGKRIVTVSEDDSTRTFTLDGTILMREIEESNHDCLPPDKRMTYLGEMVDVAEAAYETCRIVTRRTITQEP